MHLFQRVFLCSKHLSKSVLMSTIVAALYFVLGFSTSPKFLPFRSILFWKKSHVMQGRENVEVAARMGFRVWLRNVAQVEPSALVRCRGGLANTLMTIFVVSCCREDAAELVNNVSCSSCDALERTHDAQHCLDRRKLWATILSCFELGVAFHRLPSFFKTAKSFKVQLTESSPKAIQCISVQVFVYFDKT